MSIADIIGQLTFESPAEKRGKITNVKVSRDFFAKNITDLVDNHEMTLSLLFASDKTKEKGEFGIHAVLSLDASHEWLVLSTYVPLADPRYESVTKTVMAAHWYERYLHDMFGIIPEGHPDLRRLVSHENVPNGVYPLRKNFAWNEKFEKADEPYPIGHVSGEGVYEIPVGPIHAGIIEPGHFRFNVAGERILTLEGKLFFTHKGVEKILEGKTLEQALPFIERLSGDMAAANAEAFCQAAELISATEVSRKSKMVRMLIVELERMTMHIHDLANIGGMGTGYSFIAANGFRIKERLVRLSERVLGNRFWRGMIFPGGVVKELSNENLKDILKTSRGAFSEMKKITDISLSSDGFLDRLQTTGVLSKEAAKAFGAVGVPAKASGLEKDVRTNHPYDLYEEFGFSLRTKVSGDVYARYKVRIEELKETMRLVEELASKIEAEEGGIENTFETKDGFGIGAVESWRGEVLCALKMRDGVIERCFPRDPSFCNWALFAIIGPGNIVPDFPICNKSLNLSYSGTDM